MYLFSLKWHCCLNLLSLFLREYFPALYFDINEFPLKALSFIILLNEHLLFKAFFFLLLFPTPLSSVVFQGI